MRTCTSCGRTSDDEFAFCPKCGERLTTPVPTPEARRIVTILFTDIVESTALADRVDPERLRALLDEYFARVREAIERHGGTVEKFIGDAVMAVFGVPQLREDDAVRAVRAAADIRYVLGTLNADLKGRHDTSIRVRTGVATGEVMVKYRDGEMSVSGIAVNVAARLEQAATPGELLIDDATHRRVRNAVVAEELPPLSVKGKVEPLRAFSVAKVDPKAAGYARRLDAPMVGRARELSMLGDAFERTVTDHTCQLFTVLGVGGVGKSRLVDAFRTKIGDRARVVAGRCLSYGEGVTFLPVVEAIRQATGLTGAEDADRARARILEVVASDRRAGRIVAQISQILGLPDDEATPEETLWAIRRLFECLAEDSPVVLVIDDLQWGQPMLLELVEHIADWSVDSPMLLVCMARPELLEVRPEWGGGKLNATSISLEPLAAGECATLVVNLLTLDRIAPEIRDQVAVAAEGNPLFAEELVAMLIEDGRLVLRDGQWIAHGDTSLSVPPTTTALLAARIDRLPADEANVLMRASVMGQVFYGGALMALVDDPAAPAHLHSLIRKQFVRPERTETVAADAFTFRHLAIRDAAYGGLTKAARAELHARFASWLAEHIADRVELVGYHLERAVRYYEELGGEPHSELTQRATHYLRLAGQGALERGDMPACLSLLTRAADLMRGDDPRRVAVLMDLAIVHGDLGDFAAADEALERAVRMADATGDPIAGARTRQFGAWIGSGARHPELDLDQLLDEAHRQLPTFQAAHDGEGEAWAWATIAMIAWTRCQAGIAGPAWRRAADLFRADGNRRHADDMLGWLAAVPVWGPMPCAEAEQELTALAREEHGPLANLEIEGSMGMIQLMRGDVDGARSRFDAINAAMAEYGRSIMLAHNSQNLGFLETVAGDPARACRVLEESMQILVEAGSDAAATIAAVYGVALYADGRYDDARVAAARATSFTSVGSARKLTSELVMGMGVEAMVAARAGSFTSAEEKARRAIAVIDETDFVCDRADARVALAEVLELAGRTQEAAIATRDAVELYLAKGSVVQAGPARERLERLPSS